MDTADIKDSVIDIVNSVLKIGPNNLIGVDIGLSAVRVAEVQHLTKNSFKLNKFGYKFLPEGSIIEDEILRPEEIVRAILELFRDLGIGNKNVAIGLGGPNTITKRIQIVGGTKEEVFDQVMWESEQYIPFGVDDSSVGFHIYGENEGGGTDVIVAAARNDIVEGIEEVLKQANLKCRVIDMSVFALINVFDLTVGQEHINDEDGLIIIDFGAQSTTLIIHHNGGIIFTKEIAIGGAQITEEIQRQLRISYEEAEDLKINGDENGHLPEEILEIMENSLNGFLEELKKTINFFKQTEANFSLGTCYITGGNSQVSGLIEGIEEELEVKVIHLDPFQYLAVNQKNITEEILHYATYQGLTAIGLGMRKLYDRD